MKLDGQGRFKLKQVSSDRIELVIHMRVLPLDLRSTVTWADDGL